MAKGTDPMEKIKTFLKTSLIGGFIVILPAALTLMIFRWIFTIITGMIQPITNMVIARSQLHELIADAFVILIILLLCFIVGVIVRTKIGRFIQENLENRILKIAPGYTVIKETALQFMGTKKSPFSSVALVQAYENETLMTAFITDEHTDGTYTVFVPTGPNPTTGFIFHLKPQYVHPVNVSVNHAIRSVISCGAGSSKLIESHLQGKA
jgi:uncharacterized membrane protein